MIILRLATLAVAGGITLSEAVPEFLLATLGSLVAGPTAAWAYHRTLHRITDVPSAVLLQFIGTFGVWIVAERLHLSAILTVVLYGMTLARLAPDRTPARLRVPSYAVWETATFFLSVLAFALIGLQIRPILIERLDASALRQALSLAAVVLGAVRALADRGAARNGRLCALAERSRGWAAGVAALAEGRAAGRVRECAVSDSSRVGLAHGGHAGLCTDATPTPSAVAPVFVKRLATVPPAAAAEPVARLLLPVPALA